MRAALYARVSTADRDQNPNTQLFALRDFVRAQDGWSFAAEYVDKAAATDLRGRTAWRDLLNAASKRKVDLVVVWRIDRAFRSVLDAAQTLERLRGWGVGLRSYTEPWIDTTSPFGEAMFHITTAFAQLERGILRERVKAGMDRAQREGKHVGRPPVTERPDFVQRWPEVRDAVRAGTLSKKRAAKKLGVGFATLSRYLDADPDVVAATPAVHPP